MIDQDNSGAEEALTWKKSAAKADAAFRDAMQAAGFKLVTITKPQTATVHVTRGEPLLITRGGSPASQCAELGSSAARGRDTSYA